MTQHLSQSPTDPEFIQNPYPFYARARTAGDFVWWEEYGALAATSYRAVQAVLRHKRMGREQPNPAPIPEHLAPFYAIEAHSMLELEPPRHTRLRALVLRAFTSRAIAALGPWIESLCDDLIADFPDQPFDLMQAYCQPIPVLTICRMLGVPASHAPDLLRWSTAMVGMYQAGRTRADEDAAVQATTEFSAWLQELIALRRQTPSDDLLSRLIAAEESGDQLSQDELITTIILLLNAGHEATVHMIGNAARLCLLRDLRQITPGLVEECLRFDPPLHLFSRWAYEDIELFGQLIPKGARVDCLLASANRDAAQFPDPDILRPEREAKSHTSFGGGIHFCVGAPLARLEIEIALRQLFAKCPQLALSSPPRFAKIYHFHGLSALNVTRVP